MGISDSNVFPYCEKELQYMMPQNINWAGGNVPKSITLDPDTCTTGSWSGNEYGFKSMCHTCLQLKTQ